MQFNWLSNLKAVSLKTSWWLKALYVNYPGWFFTKCLNFVSKCIHTWPAATIWQCLIYDPMEIWIKGLAFFLKKKCHHVAEILLLLMLIHQSTLSQNQ
jgi:hypothetical protein